MNSRVCCVDIIKACNSCHRQSVKHTQRKFVVMGNISLRCHLLSKKETKEKLFSQKEIRNGDDMIGFESSSFQSFEAFKISHILWWCHWCCHICPLLMLDCTFYKHSNAEVQSLLFIYVQVYHRGYKIHFLNSFSISFPISKHVRSLEYTSVHFLPGKHFRFPCYAMTLWCYDVCITSKIYFFWNLPEFNYFFQINLLN